jgi:hypothetical protein
MDLMLIIPREQYEKFNKKLVTRSLKKINIAWIQLRNSMLWRYGLYLVVAISLLGFTFAYVVIFCTIYSSAALSWFIGCIVSWILLFVVVQFMFPLIHTVIRTIAHSARCKRSKGMRYIYQSTYFIL